MIAEFVERWEARKLSLGPLWREQIPERYLDLVTQVIKLLSPSPYGGEDFGRIEEISLGSYTGDNHYIIYPHDTDDQHLWHVRVAYGSCSGCDSLEDIKSMGDWIEGSNTRTIPDQAIKDLYSLALHIVQNLKELT